MARRPKGHPPSSALSGASNEHALGCVSDFEMSTLRPKGTPVSVPYLVACALLRIKRYQDFGRRSGRETSCQISCGVACLRRLPADFLAFIFIISESKLVEVVMYAVLRALQLLQVSDCYMVCGEEWSGVLLISNRRLPLLLTESSAAPQNLSFDHTYHGHTTSFFIPWCSCALRERIYWTR